MKSKEKLHRELGFWAALTIGAGTMIGAGIFLLSGLAVTLTGPAAIFAYIIPGIVCIITAASAAELATGMPTSGGDYFFVSRSLGPAFGAISGIGIWLSLTFAIAFYLFGMGEYLHRFLPISPFWGAVLGGVLFTALNIIGAKESARTQIVVVLTLLAILGAFSVFGIFNMESSNLTPFFPFGTQPVLSTTALVFISFLGFVKIAAVSEEIKEPSKNLPRALIGSVALVTLLYVLIVLVIAGIFPQDQLRNIDGDPLTEAAKLMFGNFGVGVVIFAGLLATLSSANASIMAASRINLAMARDGMIPAWFSKIHPKQLTPYRAILVTGIFAILFLLADSLEQLAKVASVLQLYSYAALNIGCIILRGADPDWYKPSYRVPGHPFLQVFAALSCLGIILYSGIVAQAIIVGLILISLGWYFWWGRSRVDIEYGLPLFQAQWSQLGWRAFFTSPVQQAVVTAPVKVQPQRAIDPIAPRRVMVALANPKHEADLLQLGQYIATGQKAGGEVLGIHFVTVPIQTPLKVAREQFTEQPSIERTIAALTTASQVNGQRPIAQTTIKGVTDVAHDVFQSLILETSQRQADLLLMGWQGGFNVSRIYNSPVQRIISNLPADVAIFKDRGFTKIDSILIPWGGGMHAQLGLEIAVRLAREVDATIDLLHIVKPNDHVEQEKKKLVESIKATVDDNELVRIHLPQNENITDGIQAFLDAKEYDLIIIGASNEWRLRNVLFGSIPDILADHASCSVLMVRRYLG